MLVMDNTRERKRRLPANLIAIALSFLTLGGCADPDGEKRVVSETGSGDAPLVTSQPDLVEIDYSRDFWKKRKAESRFLRAPKLRELALPDYPGNTAIWGATGIDSIGRMYFGIAAMNVDNPSAKLMRYSPVDEEFELLGLVNEKLDMLGVRKQQPFPETQMKIHSKIVHAGDGKVYFSTQDEHDEAGDGSRNALFGGRLFRLDPDTESEVVPLPRTGEDLKIHRQKGVSPWQGRVRHRPRRDVAHSPMSSGRKPFRCYWTATQCLPSWNG